MLNKYTYKDILKNAKNAISSNVLIFVFSIYYIITYIQEHRMIIFKSI